MSAGQYHVVAIILHYFYFMQKRIHRVVQRGRRGGHLHFALGSLLGVMQQHVFRAYFCPTQAGPLRRRAASAGRPGDGAGAARVAQVDAGAGIRWDGPLCRFIIALGVRSFVEI